jgi:uncharacterized small protein (DUF1192 family)
VLDPGRLKGLNTIWCGANRVVGETEEGMDEFDLEPRDKPRQPKDLSTLGVAELEAYIAALEAEIARARAEIMARLGQRQGAEALFRSR